MKAKILERKQGVRDMISCLVTSLADLKILEEGREEPLVPTG